MKVKDVHTPHEYQYGHQCTLATGWYFACQESVYSFRDGKLTVALFWKLGKGNVPA